MKLSDNSDIKEIFFSVSLPPDSFEQQYLTCQPLSDAPLRINSLSLDIAGRCNLACRYCAEAATQPKVRAEMEPDVLDKLWSFMKKMDIQPESFRFGSGEPMLNKALLRYLQKKIDLTFPEESNIHPKVFITTNGTLLDNGDISWLVSTGWQVKISIDGPEEVHDRWRVLPGGGGTYGAVSKAVTEFSCRMPHRFSVTAVLATGSDPEVVFFSLAALGVRRIELVPAAHNDPGTAPGLDEVTRYRDFIERYVDRLIEGHEQLPDLVRFSTRVARAMGFDNSFVQCGAGRNFFGVDPSGDLYPCFRFIGVSAYRMGNINDGVDLNLTKAFRNGAGRLWNERCTCRDCWAAPLCGGPCFAVSEMFGSGDGEPNQLYCAYTLIESHGAWRFVETLRKKDPARLLVYLPTAIQRYEKATCSGKTS